MCFLCGCDYYVDDSTSLLCEDCSAEYDTCADCGTRVLLDDLSRVYRNGYSQFVCRDCLEDHYAWCEQCDEYYYFLEVEDVQGVSLCEDCRDRNCTRCDECGEYYFSDQAEVVHVWSSPASYIRMCPYCLNNAIETEEVRWCPHCERYVYTDNEEACVSCGIVWETDEQNEEE